MNLASDTPKAWGNRVFVMACCSKPVNSQEAAIYSFFIVSLFTAHHPSQVIAEKQVADGWRWSVSHFYWAIFCFRSSQIESCLQKLSCSILNSAQVYNGRGYRVQGLCVCIGIFKCVCVCVCVCVYVICTCVLQMQTTTSPVFRGHTESVMEARWDLGVCPLSSWPQVGLPCSQSLLIFFSTQESFDLALQQ